MRRASRLFTVNAEQTQDIGIMVKNVKEDHTENNQSEQVEQSVKSFDNMKQYQNFVQRRESKMLDRALLVPVIQE